MELLVMAVSQGAPIDQLERLMGLQERWEANEARKAYVTAMTAFKAAPPEITKNKLVSYSTTKYTHATLDEVAGKVAAGLAAHGLSHSWKVQQEGEVITVSCTVTHALGHSESVSMSGAPDKSGQKNGVQQIASTVTYLQRYTLLAITGLAAKDQDSDGRGNKPTLDMDDETYLAHMGRIATADTMEALQKAWSAAYNATQDRDTRRALTVAKDQRKAELGGQK
jgi:hypothetical protein